MSLQRSRHLVAGTKTPEDNFAEFERAIQAHIEKLERAQKEAAYNKALDELYSPDPGSGEDPPSLSDTFNFELAEFFDWVNGLDLEDLDPRPTPIAMALLKELSGADKQWNWTRITEIWNEIMEEEYSVHDVKRCLGKLWSREARIRVTRLVWTAMFMGERTSIPK